MHLQITGNRDELDRFMKNFRSAFRNRYTIGHYTEDWFTPCTRACAGHSPEDGHVHVGFMVYGPPPPENDPHERVDDATAERLTELAGWGKPENHPLNDYQVSSSWPYGTNPAACQERTWPDGLGPIPCGRRLIAGVCGQHGRVVGGTIAEIAQRLVADSGAVVAVMAPDGRVYAPGDVTWVGPAVGPADGPQEPSRDTYVDEHGAAHDITDASSEEP